MWLETQRLILREFQPKDSYKLAPILANPQVMEFSPTGILSFEQTSMKVDGFINSYKKHGFGKWAIIHKRSNQLIGYCGIAVEQVDNVDEPEIGYRLAPEFWRKGLATEAAAAVVKQGFRQFNLPYILGIVEPTNTASVRVLKKLGMKYERKTIFYNNLMDIYRSNQS